LARIGVPQDCYDEVVSSGDAAQYALITGAVGRRVHHVGPDKDKVFFTELSDDLKTVAANEPPISLVSLQEAEGLVVTGLIDDLAETPDDYRATLLYAKTKGLPLLCANPDIIVDFGDKRLYCAGAIAQAYDAMGGTSLYFGKPHPPIYDLARRRLAALPRASDDPQILAVGDGITTDIQGAMGEGIDSIFITGGIAADHFGPDPATPDPALLDAWLDKLQMAPTYALGHLR
jgi:HAD superfamily hydrolase (TIGR01459 family)